MLVKKTYRLNEKTAGVLTALAQEQNCTETMVIENALKFYADYVYMQEHATVIPQEIVRVLQSTAALMEQRLNNKTNQVLSSLAIETCTLSQVIAGSLEVDKEALREYRKNAVDYLKANQRVFRMDEVAD